MYNVRKLKLGKTEQLDALARAAGELYSRALVFFWRTVRKGVWLKPSSLMRACTTEALHAHSADAVVQSFCGSLKSWRKRRQSDPQAKPPRSRRRYFKIQWKASAIRLRQGVLQLSNGRGNEPLCLPWQWNEPKLVEIGWDGSGYELRAVYVMEARTEPLGEVVAGVDLGEIHLAVAHTGHRCVIANGRALRAKRRAQNRTKAKLSRLIDTKQNGSRRRKQLVRSKHKQLRRLKNQIRDIEHKQTSRLISTLHREGVQTLVIGDVRDIRQGLDYGPQANQKLHQWTFGHTRHLLTYKAERMGMAVVLQNEAYTSQDCPACPRRHKPKGREYVCRCGFRYHRDGVGSFNIRKKYLGCGPVVGAMAPPTGLRYSPHARVARW